MLRAAAIALVLGTCTAPATASQCTYENQVETNYDVKLDKVKNYNASYHRYVEDTYKCVVSFDAVVGFKTYSIRDSYVFGSDMSANDACYQAELKAKHQLVRAVASEEISSTVNMRCLENAAVVKRDSFLKKTGKVSFRIFELAICGEPECLQ